MGGDIILCDPSEKVVHILEVLDLCEYLTMKSLDEVEKVHHRQEVS